MSVGIGARIKMARLGHEPPFTQEQLAEACQIKRSRLAQYEVERTDPPVDVLMKIAEVLNVRLTDLTEEPAGRLPRPRPQPMGTLKVYGGISAGTGSTTSFELTELDVPPQFAREDYGALVVEGDSMMPFLESSDIAIFRDWFTPKPGFVMAAELADGSWVAKMVVYEQGSYLLRSLNGKYGDIDSGYRLGGFLVGIVRDSGPERTIRLNPYGLRP